MVTSDRDTRASGSKGWYQTEEAGIQVHWLPVPYSNHMSYPERIKAFFKFASAAARKAASLRGDVIFATSTPLTIALPAVYAAKRKRVPMVFEVRDLWPELPIAMGALKGQPVIATARQLERFAYRNAAQVVALSPGMRDGIVKVGYPAKHVHVIPNSADLELFNVPAETGNSFRDRHDWLLKRPLVVYTGTMGRVNGVSYLVKLAAATKACAPDVRFLVVGGGQEEGEVQALAQQLDVLNNNFFMISHVSKQEVPAILSAATVATSLFIDLKEMWVNSANKFFDALASGTPIAINYGGWHADIIRESGAGIVLDARNVGSAKDTLLQALQNRAWLENAGRKARQLAEERFSRDRLAKELEEVLKLAVDLKSRGTSKGIDSTEGR
jgi:glycosyltransferase involved in cell wall biosynthesis